MKTKCPVCTKTKGRRDCLLNNYELICSRCCAEIRSDETCSDCPHFTEADGHGLQKKKQGGFKEFTLLVDQEVDRQVDDALKLLENKKISLSGERIDALLKKHPDQYVVHYAKGCHCVFTGEVEESIQHFKASIEIFPYFSQGWYNLSQSYKKSAQIAEFIKALQKTAEYGDPKASVFDIAKEELRDVAEMIHDQNGFTLSEFLAQYANYQSTFELMEQEDYPQAIEGFKKIIEKEPNHVQSHGNIGICYASLGHKKLALEYLDKALELDSRYEVAKNNKKLVLKMAEGAPLDAKMKSINYH
jgi:tetratricopeptide (TPR) repeat protein